MRARVLGVGTVLVSVLLVTSNGQAAVDLTGVWTVNFSGPSDTCTFTLTQSPSADVSGTLGNCYLGAPGTVTGTVDTTTGSFELDIVAPGDTLCETYYMLGTLTGNSIAGTYHCTSPSTLTGPYTGTRPNLCGNGAVDNGEDCDPGFDAPGDCCSDTCQFVPATSPCITDLDLCTLEQCDGAGQCQVAGCSPCCDAGAGCVPAPAAVCRSQLAPSGILTLKHDLPNHNDERLIWRWLRGQATALNDFGDPRTTTDYDICLYADGSPQPELIMAASVPHGSRWTATATGFKYRDPSAAAGGIKNIVLRAGGDTAAKVLVKGHGASLLPLPTTLGTLALPVTMQLRAGAQCWGSAYQTAVVNSATLLKARGGE